MEQPNGTSKNKQVIKLDLILLAILVVVFGGWILIANLTKKSSSSTGGATASPMDTGEVTQSDVENVCQGSFVLENYIDNKTAIVSALDYNATFIEAGKTKDGAQVYLLTWNGKNKETKEPVRFACYASGTKDNLSIIYLNADGIVLYGTLDF